MHKIRELLADWWDRISHSHVLMVKPGTPHTILLCQHRMPPWRQYFHAYYRTSEQEEWQEISQDELREMISAL